MRDIELKSKFVDDVRSIILTAKHDAVRSVDRTRVLMYWNLGRRIKEEEQQGKGRADYGASILKNLAIRIEPEFGSGFGWRQLYWARQFYEVYPILSALQTKLNWSQYKLLISIDDQDKKSGCAGL